VTSLLALYADLVSTIEYECYSQQFPKSDPVPGYRLRKGASVTDDREKRQEREVRETEKNKNAYNFAEGIMTRRSVS
jgi:hypothetical protein